MLNKIHIRKLCAGAQVSSLFASPSPRPITLDRVDLGHLAMYVGIFVTRLGCNTGEGGYGILQGPQSPQQTSSARVHALWYL